MTTQHSILKRFRQLHLYIGLFISPALLFFAFTGALQTFSLHETTQGSSYKPPTWIAALAQLHKKETLSIPVRKPRPPADAAPESKPRAVKPADAPLAPPPPATRPKSHLPMKIFFLLVSIGLFTSTLTGIYMAYKFNRSQLLVTGLLLAGLVVPLALLPF